MTKQARIEELQQRVNHTLQELRDLDGGQSAASIALQQSRYRYETQMARFQALILPAMLDRIQAEGHDLTEDEAEIQHRFEDAAHEYAEARDAYERYCKFPGWEE
ncbi:hypothetical protein HN747_05550 [archaeon]|jgi:hypothetical protein|nr:hypothetical protein [archaeon]